MEFTHLLYAHALAADGRSVLKALHSVLQRTPSTPPIAPPADRQKGFYTRDSVPSGCERVGMNNTRCTEGDAPAGPVKVLSTLYINNGNNNNDNHALVQTKVSAIPHKYSATTLPLHDAMPAIDICAKPTGMNPLTCGSLGVTIGFFVLCPIFVVVLSIAVWIVIRRTQKLRDEETAIEMLPRRDQYQSASKLRLKEKVRCTSRPNNVIQDSKEKFADNVLKYYSTYSEPCVPGWKAAIIREKKDNLARLPAKELPQGADGPTSSATVADILDYYH